MSNKEKDGRLQFLGLAAPRLYKLNANLEGISLTA
jgi:hypothetical protein